MPIENLLLKFIFVRKSRGRKKIWNFRQSWEKKIGKIVNFRIWEQGVGIKGTGTPNTKNHVSSKCLHVSVLKKMG